MIWAIVSDVRYYLLPNSLVLSVFILYLIYLLSLYFVGYTLSLEYIGYSFAISIVIFGFLLALFAFNMLGGGDVKLIPVVALWAGPSLTIKFLLITTVCGGIVSAAIIGYRYVRRKIFQLKSSEIVNHCVSESNEFKNEELNIPYGVAISAGGLFIAFELYQAHN
nr:prepilin peptidase [Pseudemcibacter aquimaris]